MEQGSWDKRKKDAKIPAFLEWFASLAAGMPESVKKILKCQHSWKGLHRLRRYTRKCERMLKIPAIPGMVCAAGGGMIVSVKGKQPHRCEKEKGGEA